MRLPGRLQPNANALARLLGVLILLALASQVELAMWWVWVDAVGLDVLMLLLGCQFAVWLGLDRYAWSVPVSWLKRIIVAMAACMAGGYGRQLMGYAREGAPVWLR